MKTVGRILTITLFVFLYAPIAVMIWFSFNSSRSTFVFEGFSLRWYRAVFESAQMMGALRNTLLLAVISATIATVLGTLAAVGIHNMKKGRVRGTVMGVSNIPMTNPDVVTGVSLMLLFVFVGRFLGLRPPLLGFHTILIAHITFNLPYVILNVLPKLRTLGNSLPEVARDLGSTGRQAFFKVTLPNIYPGIISGFLMAFTLSLDDFIISFFTNGIGFQTLPLLVYSTTRKQVRPDIYALSSMIFAAILLLLLLVNLTRSRENKKLNGGNKNV